MYTVESLYRYYKKFGPGHFNDFIAEHPEYRSMAKEVIKMDNDSCTVAA